MGVTGQRGCDTVTPVGVTAVTATRDNPRDKITDGAGSSPYAQPHDPQPLPAAHADRRPCDESAASSGPCEGVTPRVTPGGHRGSHPRV